MKKKVVGIIFLLVVALFLYGFAKDNVFVSNQLFSNGEVGVVDRSDPTFTAVAEMVVEKPYVVINNTIVPVEIADTPEKTQKGLSGRTTLDHNKGMLFIFPKADYYSFWMPDMNFPLDIIWISNGRVVDIHENVSNVFDPTNPETYKPKIKAQYVLEVNAGFVKENGIQEGDNFVLYK